jgi:uncharacterized protein DUF4404
MADKHARLRMLLSDLVAELRSVQAVDDATRTQLEEAATEIIQALHRAETGETPTGESLRDRLVEFEASHPNLAAVVNRLIDMLGQMGI